MGVIPVFHQNLSQSARENLRAYLQQLKDSHVEKLPSEVELAKQICVSRGTIRHALDDLEKEGLLLRIHGRGTFLNPNGFQVKVNLGALLEFGTVIQRNGYQSSSKLIALEEASASEYVAGQLQLAKGSRLFRVVRVYYADGTPAIYSLAWIPQSLFETRPERAEWELATNFELIQQYGGRLMIRDRVEIRAVTQASAVQVLGCPMEHMPEALLCLEACSFDQKNMPAIFGTAFYHTDLVRFHLFRELS